MRIQFFIFVIILLLNNQFSTAQNVQSLVIKNQYKSDLHNCIEIYTDSTNSISINEIIHLDEEFQTPNYQHNEVFVNFSKHHHWFKFELINNNERSRNIILQIKNPLIWELELYSIVNNRLEKYPTTGASYQFNTRQINNRYFAYDLHLDAKTNHTFYLKVFNNSNTINLPLQLFIPSEYNLEIAKNNLAHGLFYGIIVTVLISTFLLWLANIKKKKIKYYLWFFAYVLLIGLFNLSIDGYAFQYIWPNIPVINNLSIIIFPSLGFYFLSRFTCDFFELKRNDILLHRILMILGYLTLMTIVLLFFNSISNAFILPLLMTLIILLNLATIYTSIKLYSKVTHLSLFFLIAYVMIFVEVIAIITYLIGLGVPIEINNVIVKISTIGQFIILTIALSVKMKIQQDVVYKQSIEALQEAKGLKEKLYLELEKKVDERTKELTATKNKIQEANQLIQNKNQDLEKAFKKSSNHYIKLQKALRTINEQKENLEKANKEIQESSRLKEIFLANTSHEIRTPLNAIVGFTNLLLKSAPSEQQLKYISNIKASGENLLVVINDILDFSKIEAGKLTFEETDFNIFELFEHIQDTFKVKAEEKEVALKQKVDVDIPTYVSGDPVRLNQVFINLVGNAIKFTPNKGTVSFGANKIEKKENEVHVGFFVEDSGIGISEENLENIFESFTQAESDTTRKYGGTGLGLSIVKQLIELQNGKISVKSELNKGTRFDFDLTYKVGKEHPQLKILKKTIEYSDCHPQGLEILIVEDNEVNQQLAMDTIKLWNNNIKIDIAQNGNIAIQKSFEKKYDLILMDIQMPQMDGFETTGVIRQEKDSRNTKTPIVAMTAHAMKDERENCIKAGMNDYVSKPFEPEELFAKIKTFTCKKVVNMIENGITIDFSTVLCDKEECEFYQKPKKKKAAIPSNKPEMYVATEFLHINLENLNKLYKGDPIKVKKILQMYLDSIPKDLEDLNTAREHKNWEILKTKSHSLKPKLSYIVLSMASEYARQIERFAKNNEEFDAIVENIEKIDNEWNRAIQEIKSYLNS